jgi:RNA polymerase sigma-70 factor (ECF subfamily)
MGGPSGYDTGVRSGAHRDGTAQLRLVVGGGVAAGATKRPSLDDAQILAGVRAGDETAAAALHDRVRPQIDRTLIRLLGRRDRDHEELAQAAIVQLVMTIDRFRGDCSLDHWTARVTAHAVYNEIRRRRRMRRVFSESSDAPDPVSSTNPEHDALLRGLLHRVRECLDRLEPNKAWTLMLHDVCEYDLREIAEITSVSVSAAQTRLVRGRRELREIVESDPELAELVRRRGGAR